ncbi:flagellar filament capping protein FliD [Pseudoalteromonas sp. SWXJ133]|uniref:flagellar filament capping protein FliD n=1 Tax=Pseudoalteromonas sp. SWXJ133 TaxID=2792069 RepID=UPI0018CC84C5|nr:flagellar filament capping protein FliD [Pseudoalteromonas sp. SWXJ133]MBH0020588.1 flagellar filament capping protein FliD [Pseudoalteromonas sp. SWXJ133]
MAISFTGIGSGLQVSEIVDALVNAEKAPYQARITRQQATHTTDISAVGALKSSLEELNTSLESLGDVDNFQKRTISGSDDFVSLSSEKNAQTNNYSIKVNNLAENHKLVSEAIGADAAVGEGKLTISSGSNNFNIDVSDTATLADIRDAINDSNDNDSVNATIITDNSGQHLVLSSKETGEANAIKIVVDDVSDANNTDNAGLSRLAFDSDPASPTYAKNLNETIKATDASITIDGTLVATSSTNEFAGVIDGVTITAKKTHGVSDDLSKAKITENNNNIAAGLKSFVEKFNAFIDLSAQLGSSSAENGVGALAGDSLLRGSVNQVRALLTSEFSTGNGNTDFLSNYGIRTERSGKLSIDDDVLKKAVEDDPAAIMTFFVGENEDDGFVAKLDTVIKGYTASGGIIETRIDGREAQIDKLGEDAEDFTLRMAAYESRLLSQYNAMDLLVANMNATGSYLTQQLANLPGVVKQSS